MQYVEERSDVYCAKDVHEGLDGFEANFPSNWKRPEK